MGHWDCTWPWVWRAWGSSITLIHHSETSQIRLEGNQVSLWDTAADGDKTLPEDVVLARSTSRADIAGAVLDVAGRAGLSDLDALAERVEDLCDDLGLPEWARD